MTCGTSGSPHENQCMINATLSKEICWKLYTFSLCGRRDGPGNALAFGRLDYSLLKKNIKALNTVGNNTVEYLHQAEVTRPYAFVLALGDCSQVFTVISGLALKHGTLVGALDVCFKSYYMFDINFPTVPQLGNSYSPRCISCQE